MATSSEGRETQSDEDGARIGTSPVRLVVGDELGVLRMVDLAKKSDLTAAGVKSRYGVPSREKSVTCLASLASMKSAFLCVGRKWGTVEVYKPDTMQVLAHTFLTDGSSPVHLKHFQHKHGTLNPGVLSVWSDGYVRLHPFQEKDAKLIKEDSDEKPEKLRNILALKAAENISTADLCSERFEVAFGGEEVNLSVCDLETYKLTFISKPPKNPYQLAKRNWVTACCFVPHSNGQLIFGGNAEHEIFLYDVRSGKRPVFEMDTWREARVTRAIPEENGFHIWVANAMGYVDRFDLRKKYIKGSLTGQVAGSIRDLKLFEFASNPLIASVGLDRFLRIYSTEHRQLRLKCYCKYPLTAIEALSYSPADPDEDTHSSTSDEDEDTHSTSSEESVSDQERLKRQRQM